jgi:hypothetical protein
MVEKVVHSVSVATCCGQLATAAVDIASTRGAATVISAGLSALALRRSPNAQAELEDLCLQALHAHVAQAKLVDDVQKQILLMLDSYRPGKVEFAQVDMRADKIAKLMHDRIIDQSKVAEFKDGVILKAYKELLTATLAPLLAPRTQSEANDAELLQRSTKLDAKQDVLLAQNAEMMNLLSSQIAYPRLYEAGLSEEAIFGQIRRVSEHTNDPQAALADLKVALTRLANFEADANRPSNHSSQFDTAVAQAGVLVNQDRLSDARALLADQRERAAAEMQRLLSKEIDVALIDGDAAGAAALIVEQADHDAGGRADSAALRQLQEDYYVAGRDKGIALDLRVSIALAKLLVDRAGDSDETGAAQNNLGNALRSLGDRDSGTDKLEQAVEAYQQALKERTRDRVPLDWAMTQYNLALTYLTMFEKTAQAAHLDRAQDLLSAAAAEFAAAGASHYVDAVARLQAKIDAARWAG